LALVAIPPELGFEAPSGGGRPHLLASKAQRYGALRLPRPRRSRRTRDLPRSAATAGSTIKRAVAASAVLALILAGGFAHYRAITVEPHEMRSAHESIEAWLRHMTVTRIEPPGASPFDPVDGH
jgi:hypothetical protein